MPNWVRNTLTINAPSEELAQAFIKEMTQPHPVPVYANYEPTGEIVMSEEVFSFWNLVAPPTDSLSVYYGKRENTHFHWYDWNIENWGTKWDANGASIDKDGTELTVMFSTAWDVPREIVVAMAEKYPDLQIEWKFIEEQCWGGVFTLWAGHAEETMSWDVPSSHAEFVKFGIEDECVCEWGVEEERWFADCPRTVTESLPKVEEPTV